MKQDHRLCAECERFWQFWKGMFETDRNRFCWSYVTDEEMERFDSGYCMELVENCTMEVK